MWFMKKAPVQVLKMMSVNVAIAKNELAQIQRCVNILFIPRQKIRFDITNMKP